MQAVQLCICYMQRISIVQVYCSDVYTVHAADIVQKLIQCTAGFCILCSWIQLYYVQLYPAQLYNVHLYSVKM